MHRTLCLWARLCTQLLKACDSGSLCVCDVSEGKLVLRLSGSESQGIVHVHATLGACPDVRILTHPRSTCFQLSMQLLLGCGRLCS